MAARVPHSPARCRGQRFSIAVRVYYQDTDAGGIVYHARYLDFFERARMDWLRTIGHGATRLAADYGVTFIVRSIGIDYLRPARLDDTLEVSLAIAQLAGARLVLDQRVERSPDPLVAARVELVCVGCRDFRPARLPQPLREACAPWQLPESDRHSVTA